MVVSTRRSSAISTVNRPNKSDAAPQLERRSSKRQKSSNTQTSPSSTPIRSVIDFDAHFHSSEKTTEKQQQQQQSTIACLKPQCLAEIFKHCSMDEKRLILPLVCKRWAATLRRPSCAWQAITIAKPTTTPCTGPQTRSLLKYLQQETTPAQISMEKVQNWLLARITKTTGTTAITSTTTTAQISGSSSSNNSATKLLRSLSIGAFGDGCGEEEVPPSLDARINTILQAAATSARSIHLDLKNWGYLPSAEGMNGYLSQISTARRLISLKIENIPAELLPSNMHFACLSKCIHLKHITLRWSPATTSPLIAALPSTSSLSSTAPASREAGKDYSTFPTTLLTLTKLESLEISCPKLAGPIPAAITKLVNLRRLELPCCAFDSIPLELCRLQLLTHLNFRGNMGDCMSKAATWRTFSVLPKLKQLDLANCGFTRVPAKEEDVSEHVGYSKLTILDISGNAFGLLPYDGQLAGLKHMYNLRTLIMKSCLLSDLPEHCEVDWIRYLDVSNNQLVDLPSFVNDFGELTHLVAANNLFPALPAAALKNCNNLEVLDFSACSYLEVSSAVVEEMVHELPCLKRINMKKGSFPFQVSSKQWIEKAEQSIRVGYRRDVTFSY